jgi:hypothetical protein
MTRVNEGIRTGKREEGWAMGAGHGRGRGKRDGQCGPGMDGDRVEVPGNVLRFSIVFCL